jgi:hypothetical protein
MSTPFENAASWLLEQLQPEAGLTVSYTQGELVVSLTAIPSEVRTKTGEVNGLFTWHVGMDWLVLASDLGVEPRKGDRISATIGGESRVYELQPVGDEACFGPHDATGRSLVLHSKRVS